MKSETSGLSETWARRRVGVCKEQLEAEEKNSSSFPLSLFRETLAYLQIPAILF